MADAEVASHGGGGMAVEQHLHRFLLEFIGVDAAPALRWVFVGFHGSLLGCLVRVNLSSRSVHKSPYTSLNPWDEGGWHHLKDVEMRNLVCRDLEELQQEFHLAIGRLQQKPQLVRSFFAQAGLGI